MPIIRQKLVDKRLSMSFGRAVASMALFPSRGARKKAADSFGERYRLLDVAEMRAFEHLELGVGQRFSHGLCRLPRCAGIVPPGNDQCVPSSSK